MTVQRSKVEEHLIRIMEKRGGKRFRILRSAETSLKQYRRTPEGANR